MLILRSPLRGLRRLGCAAAILAAAGILFAAADPALSAAAPTTAEAASASDTLAAIQGGARWGESSSALVARWGAQATVLPRPIDFGDSYANVVLRDAGLGGVPVIVFFQMDKRTGELKRIQIERPRHGVNPPALRAMIGAIVADYGKPDALCRIPAGPTSGYQAGVEWLWRPARGDIAIRAIFRDTTVEAVEGCLWGGVTSGSCGLQGQILVRISPAANAASPMAAGAGAGAGAGCDGG